MKRKLTAALSAVALGFPLSANTLLGQVSQPAPVVAPTPVTPAAPVAPVTQVNPVAPVIPPAPAITIAPSGDTFLYRGGLGARVNFNSDIQTELDSPGEQSERAKLSRTERELEAKSHKLLRDYSNAIKNGSDHGPIAAELKKVLQQQFAARQAVRFLELTDLEAQLDRLRDVHQKREADKDKIISDRWDQLLRDANGLGWGSNISGGMNSNLDFNPRGPRMILGPSSSAPADAKPQPTRP